MELLKFLSDNDILLEMFTSLADMFVLAHHVSDPIFRHMALVEPDEDENAMQSNGD